MRFWDTSALIPLIVDEPATPEVRRLLADDRDVVVWMLTGVELLSTLGRLGRAAGRQADSCTQAPAHAPGIAALIVCYDAAVTLPLGHNVRAALMRVGAAVPGLRLFVLHGSQARGTAHARSDWDFAYEAERNFDADHLLADLADLLKVDRIDLVDLARAGALLRHRVAADGVVLFEREPGVFQRFRLDAVHAWCDLAPVLEPLYKRTLESLPLP